MNEKLGLETVKKSRRNIILLVIAMVVLLVAIAGIFLKGYTSAKKKSEQKIAELEAEVQRLLDEAVLLTEVTKEINIALINTEIQDIGELATVEYLYTDAGTFSDPKQLFGYNIPFTTKSFIAKWDGTIKAGVKVNEIEAKINEAAKEIIIYMAPAEILSHEVDDESIETLDEKNGLFNPIKIEDVRDFDAKTKDEMEKRAKENGILEKAYENAKDIIYKLVYTDIVEEQGYRVVFEEEEE